MENVVKVAVDLYRDQLKGNYSNSDTSESLRNYFIELNNNSTVLNYKSMRNSSKKAEMFAIIEEIITNVLEEGFRGDEFFNNMVDYRNVRQGDKNEFVVPDKSVFVVAEQAGGIATPRRQRIVNNTVLSVPTTYKSVRIYEELARVLAGRVDWNEMIDNVTKAFRHKAYNDMYTALNGITVSTVGMDANYYPTLAGTYSDDSLLSLIEHVEAATGEKARVIGTRKALKNCVGSSSYISDSAKEDMYNVGVFSNFYGTPLVRVNQIHTPGTSNFAFPDTKLWVVAGGDKPIKYVTEGDPIIVDKDATDNADLTQEYLYMDKTGCGLILAGHIGVFNFA